MPGFVDIVTDSSAKIVDENHLIMTTAMQRNTIEELEKEVDDFKVYKSKYETFVENVAKSDEEAQK